MTTISPFSSLPSCGGVVLTEVLKRKYLPKSASEKKSVLPCAIWTTLPENISTLVMVRRDVGTSFVLECTSFLISTALVSASI